MNYIVTVPFLFFSLAVFPALASDVELAEGFRVDRADELTWNPYPGFDGLEVVIISGNPNEEGPYVLRARFHPGVFSSPHYHSQDRHVTILSGTWYAGTGPSFDRDMTIALGPGDFMVHPAGGIHYDGAKEEIAIVQISGIGPVQTTRVPVTGNEQ